MRWQALATGGTRESVDEPTTSRLGRVGPSCTPLPQKAETPPVGDGVSTHCGEVLGEPLRHSRVKQSGASARERRFRA